MTEQTIDELIEDVIEREGGYVDHPADRGGPTRGGITEAVARRSGYLDDMRMLPACDAAAIYKRLYWIAPNFDRLPKWLQRLPESFSIPAATWARAPQPDFCNVR